MDRRSSHPLSSMDVVDVAIWSLNIVGGRLEHALVTWGADGARLLGVSQRDLVQRFADFLAYVHAADRGGVQEAIEAGLARGDGFAFVCRLAWRDGSSHACAARAHLRPHGQGHAVQAVGMLWEVGAGDAVCVRGAAGRLAELTVAALGDGVITVDSGGIVLYLNPMAATLTGWRPRDAVGQSLRRVLALFDETSDSLTDSAAALCLASGRAVGAAQRGRLRSRGGGVLMIEDAASPIHDGRGRIAGAVLQFRGAGAERQRLRELAWQASHDALTGLVNRNEFEHQAGAALHGARHDGRVHALLYMDLDRFKQVNDSCGHGAGDQLLRLIAKRLQALMRDSDVLARLGGDELGVLLRDCPLHQACAIAEQIRTAVLDFRFVHEGHSFRLGISIGLVQLSADSGPLSSLLAAADQACYQAKEHGRNRLHVAVAGEATRRHDDGGWHARLARACERDGFCLHSMPIHALATGAAVQHEILLRMNDERSGLLLPGAFLPAAERHDFMRTIDRWVIRAVCAHLASADASAGADATPCLYAVNLAASSVCDASLASFILARCAEFGVPPCALCFDIPESVVIAHLGAVREFMVSLRAHGFRFALDDFGSGVSSLAYLESLPLSFLKIDGLFVRGVAANPVHSAMMAAIHSVSRALGVETIAEFVEDADALAAVTALGIDFAQGYAVGPVRALH